MYFYSHTTNNSDIKIGSVRYSYTITVGIGLFMTCYSLMIVILNVLVLLTYIRNRFLQATKNTLILSLAVGDVAIGLFPVNSFTPYLIYGYWPFGRAACNFFLALNYSVCTVSTLTLLTISVDRLIAVYFPIFHRVNYTKLKISCVAIFLWFSAFLIWTPGMIMHPSTHEYNCYVEFVDNWTISLVTAFLSYYGPLLFTAIAYVLISYRLVDRHKNMYRGQARKIKRKKVSTTSSVDISVDSNEDESVDIDVTTKFIQVDGYSKDIKREKRKISQNGSTLSVQINGQTNGTEKKISVTGSTNTVNSTSNGNLSKTKGKKVFNDLYVSERTRKKSIKTHRRSLRLLLLVIIAFAVAWLPYHVLLTIDLFGKAIPIPYWNFAYIFGWANSLFNPFCYAFGNRNFKTAFFKNFRRKKRRTIRQ